MRKATGQPGRQFSNQRPAKSGDLPRKWAYPSATGLTEGDMTTTVLNGSVSVSQSIQTGFICLFIGASLVFMVGLSHISAAHNAAHDTRHSIGFPCH